MISIQNEGMVLDLLHPEAERDRMESRYSHSGYVRQIFVQGVPVLDRPCDRFDVFNGEGFPDEFQQAVGYDEAEVGGGFVKLGVGVLQKTGNHPYTNHDRQRVVQFPQHSVSVESFRAVFEQRLCFDGYGYVYRKTVELMGGSAFRIAHELKNRGEMPLHSFWYSHIFLDRNTLGLLALMRLPDGVEQRADNNLDAVAGTARLPKENEGCFWWEVSPDVRDETVVEGSALHFSAHGDFPMMAFMMYMNRRIISPEPRIKIELESGKTLSWATTYTFELNNENNY